jgi:hypothetical protein
LALSRWHRAGFQSYWRERSRKPVGRPRISAELRNLIGAMSRANHLWGAPHIHGELLKLGFTIAQSTVARYMYQGWPPSQGWRTFLTNHVDGIAAIDLFVLPTITFRLLYCLVILGHRRRLPKWRECSRRSSSVDGFGANENALRRRAPSYRILLHRNANFMPATKVRGAPA